MSATASDQPRLKLEDALGALAEADECARCAGLKLMNRRPLVVGDIEIIREIVATRAALTRLRSHICAWHPQSYPERQD